MRLLLNELPNGNNLPELLPKTHKGGLHYAESLSSTTLNMNSVGLLRACI
jgi:hypothetical protein